MKGYEEVINLLNDLLSDELTAVHQYILHAEMCADWGYGKLHDVIRKRAIDEMKHAEKLIERILFLEGKPMMGNLKEIHIGETVPKILESDLHAEQGAVKAYNRAIAFVTEKGDHGTKELLESILADEEAHLDWLETQLHLIEAMGLENYLAQQSGG